MELAAWCDEAEGRELESCQKFTEMLDEIEQELFRRTYKPTFPSMPPFAATRSTAWH